MASTARDLILLSLHVSVGAYTHQIVARTQLNGKQVSRQLSKMVQQGEVIRAIDDKGTYLYFLPPSASANISPRTLPFIDTTAMWHRVVMLKRMRDRTIEEYHPLLNAVIRDYETLLRAQEDND